jgi:hypothetical protein
VKDESQQSHIIPLQRASLFAVKLCTLLLRKTEFSLDMETHRFQRSSTLANMFGGGPDQIVIPSSYLFASDEEETPTMTDNNIMYFTEEPDDRNKDKQGGIHGMNLDTNVAFPLLESEHGSKETSGLAFSPDGRMLLFAYQHDGTLFAVEREDGLPFLGSAINLKYHQSKTDTDVVRHLLRVRGRGTFEHQ